MQNTRDKRGAVLITAVILATGIAIALGSFIALSVQTSRLSNSSFHFNTSLNLAEAAIEEAMSSINRGDWTGWTPFQGNGANLTRTLPTFDLGSGTTGEGRVVVFGYASSPTPRVVAEGRTLGNLGSSVSKQIEVRLRRRSHFATGLVAKDTITFSGGVASVDSYNSEDPAFSTGGQYDFTKRRDRGSVASARVESTTDGVELGNAKVWGFAATSGANIDIGPNGEVRGADTPGGVKVDTSRLTRDFAANFDPVTAPTTGFTTIYGNVNSTTTFGTAGASTLIQVSNLTANNAGDVFTIQGDVTMVVTGTITIKGSIVVAPNSSLTLYAAGNVTIGGNGIVNSSNLPRNAIIYGTHGTPGGQTIKLHGNGALQAAVYAPNATVEMKGGGSSGEMSGSVIGHSIKITGTYAFHYDEALSNLGTGNPFAVTLWRELSSPADRISF